MSENASSSDNRQGEANPSRQGEANAQRRPRRRPSNRDRKPAEENKANRPAPASTTQPEPLNRSENQVEKEPRQGMKGQPTLPEMESPESLPKNEPQKVRKQKQPAKEETKKTGKGEEQQPSKSQPKQSGNSEQKKDDKGQPKQGDKNRQKRDERKGERYSKQRGGNRPLISIITITYNASRELEPTMKSIREQTYKNFEHLIIDGASTDDTIITARLYRSPNLRIFSEPDEGLYDAMNKGLHMARGRYVLFMNAGDTFHTPDSLARYANAAENNNADIIYGDTVIVNEERQILRPRHLSVPGSLTSRSFLKGMLICHQALMVKKEIAPEYDLRYRFSADYDWAIKVINKSRPGKRINLQTVTTDYLYAGLTEKNKLKSLRERFKVMSEHYGTGAALISHLSFIPRALGRRLGKK